MQMPSNLPIGLAKGMPHEACFKENVYQTENEASYGEHLVNSRKGESRD
jgi:hypothetical protein